MQLNSSAPEPPHPHSLDLLLPRPPRGPRVDRLFDAGVRPRRRALLSRDEASWPRVGSALRGPFEVGSRRHLRDQERIRRLHSPTLRARATWPRDRRVRSIHPPKSTTPRGRAGCPRTPPALRDYSIRIPFTTTASPPLTMRTRYSPEATAAPSSSRPSHRITCTSATSGASWSTRTRRPRAS